MKEFKSIIVFCDGACSGNPGEGGWGVIVATPDGKVWELGGREAVTTNKKMELTAAIEALTFVKDKKGEIFVHTDSTYVIHGITNWIHGWVKRDWRSLEGKAVANRDLWEQLFYLVNAREVSGEKVIWKYVRGHAGVPGNDRADAIAVAFSKKKRPALYEGPLIKYGVAIHDIPEGGGDAPKMKPKGTKKAPGYSYVSVVGGIPYIHQTWAECERRVKGQSSAKFKKTTSAEDESQILTSWGFDPSKVKK